jgi:hypothetical protein
MLGNKRVRNTLDIQLLHPIIFSTYEVANVNSAANLETDKVFHTWFSPFRLFLVDLTDRT